MSTATAGPSTAAPAAPPQPGPASPTVGVVNKSVSATAIASGSKPTSSTEQHENATAASYHSTSSPLSPLSPRTSMAQAMATNVTASGTTSIPSPSSTTTAAGILPSPALSSPGFPSYTTSSPSSRAGSSSAALLQQQHQQQPRSHPGPPPSSIGGNSQATRGGPPSTTNTNTNASSVMPPLHTHLPSTTTTLHMTEAREALVATMSNLFDTELQSRASLLHANASQLSRQESDVAKATEGLRKETDKLAKVARDAGRRIKETGNVQNWAEVLERDFLVLEETLRLAREGSERDYSSSGSGSYWSGSESEMDIDEAVGAGAAATASASGKTVEEVVVQKDDDGADDNEPIAATTDMDVDMDGTSGTPAAAATTPGPDGKEDGQEEEMKEQDNGHFSHVDNAIEASIREAMATSMHDDPTEVVARSETTLEGGSTSSVHRKAKEIADYDKMDLDASERSFPSTGRTLSRESVSDVASGSGPLPPAGI
ncbi:Ribosomal protein L37ae [Apiospora arundinis]